MPGLETQGLYLMVLRESKVSPPCYCSSEISSFVGFSVTFVTACKAQLPLSWAAAVYILESSPSTRGLQRRPGWWQAAHLARQSTPVGVGLEASPGQQWGREGSAGGWTPSEPWAWSCPATRQQSHPKGSSQVSRELLSMPGTWVGVMLHKPRANMDILHSSVSCSTMHKRNTSL